MFPPDDGRPDRGAGAPEAISTGRRDDGASVHDAFTAAAAPWPDTEATVELEAVTLGCVLLRGEARAALLDHLAPELFDYELHRHALEVIRHLADVGPVDPALVAYELACRQEAGAAPVTESAPALVQRIIRTPWAPTRAVAEAALAELRARLDRRREIQQHLAALRRLGVDVELDDGDGEVAA